MRNWTMHRNKSNSSKWNLSLIHIFCLPQIQYPGYGFQYLCNIADADFLGTLAVSYTHLDVYKRQV